MEEHQKILQVMKKVEFHIDQRNHDLSYLEDALRFFCYYVVDFHEKKEEVLFEWMAKNMPSLEFGVIARMQTEHDLGRSMVKRSIEFLEKLKTDFDKHLYEKICEDIETFIYLRRDHITRENNILYAMARNIDININGGDEYMMPIFEKVKLSEANKLHVSQF
jgi:hemerythrin-like domain-containing protein